MKQNRNIIWLSTIAGAEEPQGGQVEGRTEEGGSNAQEAKNSGPASRHHSGLELGESLNRGDLLDVVFVRSYGCDGVD